MTTSTVEAIRERLAGVDDKIQAAVRATTADSGASPVLAAVIEDFGRKSAKAVEQAGGDGTAARDAVIELEQAGDSAKYAAEADTGLTDDTRKAVLAAHLAICILKAETAG
jgi:hypothetical protein